MNFLREEGSGIPTPYSVRIEAFRRQRKLAHTSPNGCRPNHRGQRHQALRLHRAPGKCPEAQARYVKLHINFQIWLFIDEIEIFDRKETPDQGTDVPPDDLPSVDLADGLALECPARAAVRRARH